MVEDFEKLTAAFTLKGLSGQIVAGEKGNYLADPSEWGESNNSQSLYEYEYMNWHQTYHAKAGVRDGRCRICQAEAKFYAEKRPHDEFHKARGHFEPSCRFCQDDKFFGRM